MKAPVPTLAGFIKEPYAAIDYLMGCFFKSEASQSTLFLKQISSLPDLVRLHGHQPSDLASAVKATLQTLLNRYFDTVEITSAYTDVNNADDNRYGIKTSIYLVDDGKTYNVGRIVSIKDSIILNIINETN